MSYTFLAETGEESWVESFAEIPACALSNQTQIAEGHFCNASGTRFYHRSQSGMTCEHLTEGRGEELLKSCQGDFLARTFLPQEPTTTSTENKWGLMEKALAYGRKWRESLARHNLSLSVLRTPQIYALKDLSESSKDLTAWGMMQDGVCLTVAVSVQTMCEPECSLLPTPTAHNSKEGAYPAEYTRNTKTLAASIGGKINPDWNEWRMGCPIRWGGFDALEIDKFQQWLALHGKP